MCSYERLCEWGRSPRANSIVAAIAPRSAFCDAVASMLVKIRPRGDMRVLITTLKCPSKAGF